MNMGTLIFFLIPAAAVCHKEGGNKLESARNRGTDSRVVPATLSSQSPRHSGSGITTKPSVALSDWSSVKTVVQGRMDTSRSSGHRSATATRSVGMMNLTRNTVSKRRQFLNHFSNR